MRRNLVVFALTCLAMLLLAIPAGAQEDVMVDPDSPTGSEYDIPLERARRDAATDQSQAAQSYRSRTAPLFGEGIGVAGASASQPPSRSGTTTGKRSKPGKQRTRKAGTPTQQQLPRAVRAAIQQPGAPDDSTAQLAALGGAILVALAAIGGLVLRRSRR